ncbi:MAG: CoA transferase [Nocardioides sp.]
MRGGLACRRPRAISLGTNPERVEHRAALVELLESRLAADTAARWVERLTEAGVAAGEVNDLGQALALADRLGLQPTVDVGDGYPRQVRHPVRWSRSRLPDPTPPPVLGEHTADLRSTLEEQS